MSKNGDNSPSSSKKWQKRRTTVALSVGTCLVMGILALEITRQQGPLGLPLTAKEEEVTNKNLIILKNPEDRRLHRDLSELESKMHETKRLLFARENALDSGKMQSLKEKLQIKTLAANDLEQKNNELHYTLQTEKQKVSDFEKTNIALLDNIELHKNAKEESRQKLLAEINELRTEHEQQKNLLERRLSTQQDREHELITLLNTKEEVLAELQQEMASTFHQHTYTQQEAAQNKEAARNLENDILALKNQLQNHEQAGVDLERTLTESKNAYEAKIDYLNAELQKNQHENEASLQALTAYKEKISELENHLAQKEEEHRTLLTQLTTKSFEAEHLASESDNVIAQAGESLSEKEDTLALERTYSEVVSYRLRQQAARDKEERLTLEQNVQDFREQVEKNQEQIKELIAQQEAKERDIAELTAKLEAERTEATTLITTLQNQPPVRDTDKEQELEKELFAEKESSLRLQEALMQRTELQAQIESQIAILETDLMDTRQTSQSTVEQHQTHLTALQTEIAGMKQNLDDLAKELEVAKQEKVKLEETAKIHIASLEAKPSRDADREEELERQIATLKETLTDLNESLDDALTDKQDAETQIAALQARPTRDEDREKELEQKIAGLQETLEDLKGSLNDAEQDRKEAQTLIATLQAKPTRDSEKEQDLETKISSLEKSVEDLNNRLEMAAKEKEEAQEQIAALQARPTRDTDKEHELETKIANLEKSVNDLTARLDVTTEQKEDAEQQIAALQARPTRDEDKEHELETKIANLEKSVNDLTARLDAATEQKEDAEQQIAALQAKPTRDEGKEHELETKIANYEKSVNDLTARLDAATEQKEDAEQQIATLQARPTHNEEHESELENEIVVLKQAIVDLNARHALTCKEKEEAEDKISYLQERPSRDEEREAALENYIAGLQESMSELTALQTESEAEKQELQNLIYSLQNRPTNDAEKEAALEQEVAALQHTLNTISDQIQQEKELKLAYKQELYELTQRHEQTRSEKQHVENLNEELMGRPTRDAVKETELEHQIFTLEYALNELNYDYRSEKEQKARFESELQELTARLEQVRNEKRDAEQVAADLRSAPPVRDTAKEEELEKQIQGKEVELESLRVSVANLNELSKEIDALSQKLVQQSEKNETDLMRASEQELHYQDRIADLEHVIQNLKKEQELNESVREY